jgi:hypothetical protein
MMRKLFSTVLRSFPALLLVSALAPSAVAQFWEKKDWREWSKSECEKMLNDSPWARKFQNVIVVHQSIGGPEREQTPTISYVAQLRSALPIRQAVVRSMQFQAKYDKMSDAEKNSFDQQAESYLNQDFSDRVVVHIIYDSNVTVYRKNIADIWRSSEATLRTHLWLVPDKGNRVEIGQYIGPEGGAPEFELIFPKELAGNRVISEDHRRFSVEIPGVSFTEPRILIEFDVRKMKYRGTFEY